jgi:AcrR family transcriptional regulator
MNAPRKRSGVGGKFTARLRRSERKRQILQHAKQLFVSLGYQHTTTDKIARAAGVTEPVLYRHFASKKALFLDVLNEVRQATLERWQAETLAQPDPLARLNVLMRLYIGGTREPAVEQRIMHRTLIEAEDPDIAACLRLFYLDTETLLSQVIAEGQRSHQFRSELDPRVVAWEFIRNALGFTLTLPLSIPLFQEENYLPKAVSCMLGCLMGKESSQAGL